MTIAAQSDAAKEGRATTPLARFTGFLRRPALMSLLDQFLVSGIGFIALVVVGTAGLTELGIYALCVSIVALALAAQEALVTRPYVVQMHRGGNKQGLESGALSASLALGSISCALLLTVSITLLITGHEQSAQAGTTLAFLMPFALLREFVRRYGFAHQMTGSTLVLDAGVVTINALALGLLGSVGMLGAQTALGASGLSCAIACAVWFFHERRRFSPGFAAMRIVMVQFWGMGKWLLVAQTAIQAHGYATHWITMAVAGPVLTGVYAACTSIVALTNPLLFGLLNWMVPRSARVFSTGGRRGLHQQTVRDAVMLGAMMVAFSMALWIFGEAIIGILFPAASGHAEVLLLLALASTAGAVGVPASTALTSAGHPRAVAGVTFATAIFSVLAVWWLLASYGLVGAAFGFLAAELLGSIGRWTAFLVLVPRKVADNGEAT